MQEEKVLLSGNRIRYSLMQHCTGILSMVYLTTENYAHCSMLFLCSEFWCFNLYLSILLAGSGSITQKISHSFTYYVAVDNMNLQNVEVLIYTINLYLCSSFNFIYIALL